VLSGSADGVLRLWRLQDGQLLDSHTEPVPCATTALELLGPLLVRVVSMQGACSSGRANATFTLVARRPRVSRVMGCQDDRKSRACMAWNAAFVHVVWRCVAYRTTVARLAAGIYTRLLPIMDPWC